MPDPDPHIGVSLGRRGEFIVVRHMYPAAHVDLSTLLLAACMARAPDVDVGPCECEARGRACCREWHSNFEADPRTVPAPVAVIMAGSHGPARDLHVAADTDELAAQAGAGRRHPETDAELRARLESMRWPGHKGARQALVRLVDGWREHLPVLADWLTERGMMDDPAVRSSIKLWSRDTRGPLNLADWLAAKGSEDIDWLIDPSWGRCPSVPRALAECPALPVWVEAWLAAAPSPAASARCSRPSRSSARRARCERLASCRWRFRHQPWLCRCLRRTVVMWSLSTIATRT